MKKKIGIIIGVVVAIVAIVVGVIFLTKDNSTSGDIGPLCDSLEIADWKTTGIREYGIAEEAEFSEGYVTSAGTVYVIRDTRMGEGDDDWQVSSKTYIALETDDKVWIDECLDYGDSYVPELVEALELKLADIDDDGVEEIFILLSMHNHGAPGRGQNYSMIWKIYDNGIAEIFNGDEFDNGFSAELKQGYLAEITNKFVEYSYEFDCSLDEDEFFFDEEGNPCYDDEYFTVSEVVFHPIWNFDIKDVNGDGKNEVMLKQWIWLADCTDMEMDAVTTIAFNDGEFEVVDATVEVSAEKSYVFYDTTEFEQDENNKNAVYDRVIEAFDDNFPLEEDAHDDSHRSYTFWDINEDGMDELIIHTGYYQYEKMYHIYTYADNIIVGVGRLSADRYSPHDGNRTIIFAGGQSDMEWYSTYRMVDNQLVLIENGEQTLEMNEEFDFDKYGPAIELNERY